MIFNILAAQSVDITKRPKLSRTIRVPSAEKPLIYGCVLSVAMLDVVGTSLHMLTGLSFQLFDNLFRHFEATFHTFTLQIGGNLVWDYAGDNYVHRLIQSSTDGKVVEHQGRNLDPDQKSDDKIDAIQLEYSFLLTNQLESQRLYFEELLKQHEEKMEKFEKLTALQV